MKAGKGKPHEEKGISGGVWRKDCRAYRWTDKCDAQVNPKLRKHHSFRLVE